MSDNNSYTFNKGEKKSFTFTNEISIVEVSSLGAKIVLIPQQRSDIYVEYDNPNDTPEFCAVLSGNTLSLKENFTFGIFGSKPKGNYTISVYLPLKTFEKIKVNTASGGVEVGEVSSEEFILNTASGTINVNAFFNNVKLQSASGSVNLRNPLTAAPNGEFVENKEQLPENLTANSVSVCTVSGNATVSGYLTREFGIHSVSGNTSVEGISGKGRISATSGNINITYADWNDDLDISLISGNVNVSLPENAGIELNVSGVSGNVKTDLGQSRGNFLNLGKGTNGSFGGENKHKINAALTSGTVTVAQK